LRQLLAAAIAVFVCLTEKTGKQSNSFTSFPDQKKTNTKPKT